MSKPTSMLAGVMGLWAAVAFTQAQGAEPEANANEKIFKLPTLSVKAQRPESLTVPSPAQARQALREVPGNTGLIETQPVREGRVGSLADILDQSPSIYSQSRFGGSEDLISIRGSGITQTWESRGVRLLRDGLPLTEADGMNRSQLVNPLIVRFAEVY
ncbi:MAG TPA: Plug domain-containing protein, partial [Nitrococcus sp.]|nr:Plug domain-containing protein [Nitrococcus sp.]